MVNCDCTWPSCGLLWSTCECKSDSDTRLTANCCCFFSCRPKLWFWNSIVLVLTLLLAAAQVFAIALDTYFQLTIMLLILILGVIAFAFFHPFTDGLMQGMQVRLFCLMAVGLPIGLPVALPAGVLLMCLLPIGLPAVIASDIPQWCTSAPCPCSDGLLPLPTAGPYQSLPVANCSLPIAFQQPLSTPRCPVYNASVPAPAAVPPLHFAQALLLQRCLANLPPDVTCSGDVPPYANVPTQTPSYIALSASPPML